MDRIKMTSPLSFAVLGPVRAWRGQSEIDLGTRQQRLILALLLARAGGAVSVAELVDLLWESDPPSSAVNVVHRHVGMLRRRFEPGLPTRAAGSVLIRDGAEYRLRIDGESLDLLRFRRLVAQAAGSSGEPAVELYREALALWRDRCASGLQAGGRPHPEFVAVDGERFAAVRAATDAALGAGCVQAVLPAIRLAAEYEPLDEALQARLLLALAADGRRAEALAAYADIEHRLADELGIQPGSELRAARDSLLDHDAPAAGSRSRRGVRPAFIRPGAPPSGAEPNYGRQPSWSCRSRPGPSGRRSCRPTTPTSPAAAASWPPRRRCSPVTSGPPRSSSTECPASARPPSRCTWPTSWPLAIPMVSCTRTCAVSTPATR
ncbi:BTAD domain-containing putative transcriptional regulator [Micromonospora sp. ATA51]|uniref:AfsR/SARP family transcriptional regulator n=1 Tax=Micromonospora sp. ATA51 TaxID=2806098 RepID=UPI001A5AA5F4|nr:BTAD domain-containing putative transcriptional regulator [Micromonospora sp. ATA51]MBM0226370.1 winged helix-turn-helix domain-containing protein [Micromonospora sp. ATA51]